jgi:hypothetical protein
VSVTAGADVPAVHDPVAFAEYSMLSTVSSAGLFAHIPFTGKDRAAVPVQLAFVKAETVALPHAVDTEQALQVLQARDAPLSTVKAWTNGVDAGHAFAPAETMHAEKPVGGLPLQTASALAPGTLQVRCVGSVTAPASGCAVLVHAPPAPVAASGDAWKLPRFPCCPDGTGMHCVPLTVAVNHGVTQLSLPWPGLVLIASEPEPQDPVCVTAQLQVHAPAATTGVPDTMFSV